MNRKQKRILIRIIIASAFMIASGFIPVDGWARLVLCLIPYLTIGYDILIKAWKGVVNRQPFDENFLMAVATVGAMVLGEYIEGAAVMLFYQIGELFQSVAVGKSRRNIAALMDISPDYANLEREGEIVQVDPDEVGIDSVIVVRPGEKIPIDGVVAEGASTLDTAALTGESVPRNVGVGEAVISGCINLTGVIKVRTTREFGESTVSRILDLVENASSKKSRSENFISRFAKYYTPTVCYSALALALLPPVFRALLLNLPADFSVWIYRALTFLVISCPCALVISIPLSFFAGIGGASNAGVLVKGSNYLEALAEVSTVVFDKTGTMTKGSFEVTQVCANGADERELLEYASLAESFSTHPISRSICRAAGEVDKTRVSDVKEISGHGVTAQIDGKAVAVGNLRLMKSLGISARETDFSGTVVYVAIGGECSGYIMISDELKPDAKTAVTALRASGIKRMVMLTGDAQAVGESVARELSIAEVYSELLPGDKVELCEKLLAEKGRGEKLAFVGDGINDAPVLSRADIGIAMGALGSDAAIEAADIVLMDDNPLKIAKAIRISKKCMRIVYENIYFAIGIKLLCLMFGAFGVANMWFAIFADVGVMVLAVLNAMRALYVKKL
ncbi:MAG: cadmium-translocating P-type ATPase [Oscillospiraceae bacterium]|nr:cadmium-translocating P-type ATPase [Oscillospiraceae bacterium]